MSEELADVDYISRKDMIAALLDLRGRGVEVTVVGNGRTLRFAQETDETGSGAVLEADEPAVATEGQPDEPEAVSEAPEVEEDLVGVSTTPGRRKPKAQR